MKFKLAFLFFIFSALIVAGQDTLTLSQAIEQGLKNNYSIIIAKNEARIAEISNPGFMEMLPDVSANASQNTNVNDTEQQFFSGETREKKGAKSNSLNAGVALNWTVFDGFGMFASLDQFNEFEKIGALNARVRIENTLYEIIRAYYDIVQYQKQIEVVKTAIAISNERKIIAEEKFKIGSGSGLDVLQASVDMNSDSSALLRQESLLLGSKIYLNQLLARAPETPFAVASDISIADNLQYETLLKQMSEQNPELEAARRTAHLAELEKKKIRSGYLPTVDLNSGYNYAKSASEIGVLQSNKSAGINYGITASWTLFNGFYINRQLRVAQVQQLNREQELLETELNLKSNLYRSFTNYKTSLTLVSLEINSLEIARKNLEIATEKMRIGTLNALELREAQRSLVDAEFRLILAQYEVKTAEAELLRISGQLFKTP